MRVSALAGVTLVKEHYPSVTIDVKHFPVRDHGVISEPEITGYIVEVLYIASSECTVLLKCVYYITMFYSIRYLSS